MRKIALLIIMCLSTVFGYAQVKFEAHAPLQVRAGERFRIEFVLTNGQGSNFVQPSISGAEILAGPSLASGSQTTFINGKQSTTTTETYTFIAHAPQAGTIKVGTATVVTNGKSYTSKSLTIDALAANADQSATQNSKGGVSSDDVLLRLEVNKSNVYKGEAIVATLKLYTRINITGVENVKYAAFNGFWTQEIDAAGGQPSRATIGGKTYSAQVVRQWLIFPQKAGSLEIEQNEFTIVAEVVSQGSGAGSLLEEFFGGMSSVDYVKRKISSPRVKISVRELPKPEPINFSGAVGNFTMESSISGNKIAANNSGNITVKLSGSGNFPLITTPELVLPAAFEKYDVKINDQVKYSSSGASGSKVYEYPFITRAEGNYSISPIEFVYFDLNSKSYKTLSSGSFNIEITKGNGSSQSSGAFISGVTKEDLKMLGQDVRFIKVGDPKLISKDNQFLWSLGFFGCFALILGLFGVMMFVLRKMIAQQADVAKVKNKKANKVALRRLKKSNTYLQSNDKDKFYEEMLRALWGYLGDKLTIEVADLTKEHVLEQLVSRGVSEEQATEFLNLIGSCEYAQYSPSSEGDMNKLYNQALDLIGNMEVK